MKAAQINQYGHADQIEIVDTAAPAVLPGKVQIEVHAASINPFDTAVREGHVKMPQLPFTLGGDLAGVITEVGADVEGFAIGDKVYGQAHVIAGNTGAFAEFAATSAGQVAKMPANLSFNEAAALPLVAVSALQVIKEQMHLQAGQKVLIHGGAGGIGTVAIQIAKGIGAYVATTATGEGLEYVKQLGADEIIDYKSQQFDDLLRDFDAVFDTVAGETYDRSFKVLKRGGAIVSMLEQPKTDLVEQYGVTAIAQQTRVTTTWLNQLRELVEAGVVTPHVDKIFPLEQAASAFEARESGTVKGKVVLQIKN